MASNQTNINKTAAELIAGGGLEHIAFIMDGNGRWAEKRGMPRRFGHSYGAKAFRTVIRHCGDIGIKAVTVYAFSTENWARPKEEVDSIMKLLREYVDECEKCADKENLKVRFIGDMSRFDAEFQKRISGLEKKTENNGLSLNIALNYGGRNEIVRACNKLIAKGLTTVTEQDITDSLDTHGIKDPDLIIRTAGEERLSNFLMWQSAYSEFWFCDTLWPDMSEKEVDEAVFAFYKRKRRFGKV